MNRAKLIRLSIRLANSCSATRKKGIRSFCSNQVTHLSYFSQCKQLIKPFFKSVTPNLCKSSYLSTNHESFVQIVLSNDWSDETKNKLKTSNPNLTNESVTYFLAKFSDNPKKSLDFFHWVTKYKKFKPSYVPYTIMLRTLARKEFMTEFWNIADKFKGNELGVLEPQFFEDIEKDFELEKLDHDVKRWRKFHKSLNEIDGGNNVGNKVVEVILGSDWGEEVESELEKLEFPLCEKFLFRVFRKLREEPLKAMKFFDWVAESRGYEHNSVTYSEMARILSKRGLIGEFWDLVTRMRSEGFEIDSYPHISRALSHVSMEEGVKLFEFMMDGPLKLSVKECMWRLEDLVLASDPDFDLMNRVVNKFVGAGNSLTKAVYDIFHWSLCKDGRLDEAKKIVEIMKNDGYEPDQVTYGQEVFCLCKLQRFENAYQVLNRMEEEGCVPDIKTWTILIQGFIAAGQVDNARLCCLQMLEKNYAVDAILISILVKGFLSNGKLLGAYEFLVEMVMNAGLKPLQRTYQLMTRKLLEGGKFEEAIDLIVLIRRHRYLPNYKIIAKYISRTGTLEDAKKLLETAVLSQSALDNTIESFCKQGRHAEAKDLLCNSPREIRARREFRFLLGSNGLQF